MIVIYWRPLCFIHFTKIAIPWKSLRHVCSEESSKIDYWFKLILAAGFHCVETFAAIHRLALTRLERYFTILAAPSTGSSEHLSRSCISPIAPAPLWFSVLAAGKTTLRLIGVAFRSEKFLLSRGECEWVPAVYACDLFVLIGHWICSSIILSLVSFE